MIQEGFKETEIGVIPRDWEVRKISELFKVTSGSSLPQKNIINGDYPVYGGNGITAYHNEYEFEESKIVIGRVGAYCGCIHKTLPKSCITDNALYIKEKKIDYDNLFMFYKLTHIDLHKYANQNAQPVISGEKIYPLFIGLPKSLTEQQRIADILSTTDTHIERLDKLIEDYELLKKGMMKKLLTEGIGNTEFKDTEIGKIPKTWSVSPIFKTGQYINGKAFKPKDWSNWGTPIIRIQNLSNRNADFNYVTEEVEEKYIVNRNDILFSWSGTLGVYKWQGDKAYLNQHIYKVIPNQGIAPDYLAYQLEYAIERMAELSHGSTMKHITKGNLEKFVIAIPPLGEQFEIANIINGINKSLDLHKQEHQDFTQLKRSLMEKLLTGKIRTTELKSMEG